ncbi:odorant receptor 33b-like [Diachasmimorpha longicaudata]|uniref:odorant receptor 33b-like n=1 Tax=Diachasmimorpha longicaudata TaxID=58733 RepID=UPI0030B8A30A
MCDFILERYNTCDKIVRILLRYCPIWSTTRLQLSVKIFLQCYASIVGTVISFASFHKAFATSDISTMTECLVPAVTLLAIPIKLMVTVIYKHTFIDIYDQLDRDLRFYCADEATVTLNKMSVKMFSLSMKFLFICYKALVFNYIIIPPFFILYQIITDVSPVRLIFPYPGTYPEIFTSNCIIFVVVYLLETINVIVGASTSLGDDCFFGLVVFQMCTILNVLSNRVKNAKENNELFTTLRECIDKHCQLMDFAHRLEPIYALIVLPQRVTDAIVICATIYQIHEISGFDVSQILLYSSWLAVKYLQLLTTAWYGSMLITESEKLSTTIYSCNWPDFYNKKFMTNVIHVLQQKSIMINVYGFFVISIPMASTVIRASFSYFFLLQSFK